MSARDLNTLVKELVEKEMERILSYAKEDIKNTISLIDRKIEELRQYLKTLES